MAQYDYIVSLGGMCEPAWNIRNTFRTEDAYPFDWLITPGDSLIRILKDDMRHVGRIENLQIVSDGETVRCKHYEILHHHDFRRSPDHKIIPELESQVEGIRSKYRFLWQRFLTRCSSGQVLFVRAEGNYSPANDWIPRGWDWDDELCAALERKFPSLDFDLLAVRGHAHGRRGRVISDCWRPIGEPSGDWRGWPDGWSDMFRRLDVRIS